MISNKTKLISVSKFVLMLSMALILNACSAESRPVAVNAQNNYNSDAVYVVVHNGWASIDVMNLKKVIDNNNNEELLKQMYAQRAIFPLKQGIKVKIVEEHQGIVRVEPIGSDVAVWTFKGLLKKE